MRGRQGAEEIPLKTVHFESPSHTGILLSGLSMLHAKGLLLDVTLIAGGQEFKAHRVVLASCSEYFRAMFTDALKESRLNKICMQGVSAQGLRYLLEYVYTSRLVLNLANIQDILSAANHVQLFAVVEACSAYLQEQLDVENCIDIATIAETYCLHQLRKRVYQFMCSSLYHFSRSADFQRLSAMQLEHLLACDYPVDCDETEVLNILVRWLEYDHERLPLARQLLKNIHFEEIPFQHVAQFMESQLFQNIVACSMQLHPIEYRLALSCCSFSQRLIDNTCCGPPSLPNSRGMEMAIIKVGGFGLGGITNDITYYLPSVGKWCHLTSIPHVEQCNYGTVVLNNELYVIGGCFNQSLQENIHPFGFKFNPRDNRWTTLSPMQQERCRFSLGVVVGQLYAIGGVCEGGEEAPPDETLCEKYDPESDTWVGVAPLPSRRAQHACATWGRFLFLSGGLDQEFVLNSIICYDTIHDEWLSKASMLLPRADHSMVAYKDKLYVCGGWYEDETSGNRVILETIDSYDILTDRWEVLTRVPTPRYHAASIVVEGKLYIIGGFHSDVVFGRATGVIECYSFSDGTWTTIDPYPQDIWEHSCVTLYVPRFREDMEVMPDENCS